MDFLIIGLPTPPGNWEECSICASKIGSHVLCLDCRKRREECHNLQFELHKKASDRELLPTEKFDGFDFKSFEKCIHKCDHTSSDKKCDRLAIWGIENDIDDDEERAATVVFACNKHLVNLLDVQTNYRLVALKQEPYIEIPDNMFFFGCWSNKEAGHYLHDIHGHHIWNKGDKSIPFDLRELDGPFAPKGQEVECRCLVHHLRNWTLLGFWDRSGDSRPGSNSVFLAPGKLSFESMVAGATEKFPGVIKRLHFQLTQFDE